MGEHRLNYPASCMVKGELNTSVRMTCGKLPICPKVAMRTHLRSGNSMLQNVVRGRVRWQPGYSSQAQTLCAVPTSSQVPRIGRHVLNLATGMMYLL